MAEEIKNKGGRPKDSRTKYKNTMPERAFAVLKDGGLLCHVAAELGIDRDTLRLWQKDPRKAKFRDAVQRGLAISEAYHADRLIKIARDGHGNVSAQLRIMEWGFGWKNVQTVETLDEQPKSLEEIEKRIAELQGPGSNVVSIKK